MDMVGKTKPFSQEDHDKYDPFDRTAVVAWAMRKGYTVKQGTRYGIDLWVNGFGLELEHRVGWKGARCGYPVIHVLERKKKFFRKGVFFAIVNDERTHMLVCHTIVIDKYPLVETPNSIVPEGEYVYKVDKKEFKLIELGG